MSEPDTTTTLHFRPAGPNDAVLIGRLVTEAFKREDEARLVGALRTSDEFLLELVASDGINILGHLIFSRARITDGDTALQIAILAPLAVREDMQKTGIGTALVEEGLRRLKADGLDIVVVVGDPAYYARFGFSPGLGEKFDTPWQGPHFMAIELKEGAGERVPATLTFAPALLAID